MSDRTSARLRLTEAIEAAEQFVRHLENAIDAVEEVKPRKAVGLRNKRTVVGAFICDLRELKESLEND